MTNNIANLFTSIGDILSSIDHTGSPTTNTYTASSNIFLKAAKYSKNDVVNYGSYAVVVEDVYLDGIHLNSKDQELSASNDMPVYKIRRLEYDKETGEFTPTNITEIVMESSISNFSKEFVDTVDVKTKRNLIGKHVIIKETDGFGIIAWATEELYQVLEYDENLNPMYRELTTVNRVYYKPEDVEIIEAEPMMEMSKSLDSFQIYEKDGSLYWLGIYSNNFIDKDSDILTSEAHENFVKMVNQGDLPYPELWVAHYPVQVGTVEMIDFHKESGMAISGGRILKDFEEMMKKLVINSKEKGYNLAMSHGFGRDTVVFDESGYMKSYASRELTVTPFPANVYTAYTVPEVENE